MLRGLLDRWGRHHERRTYHHLLENAQRLDNEARFWDRMADEIDHDKEREEEVVTWRVRAGLRRDQAAEVRRMAEKLRADL